jgi:phenylpropionate dioxygenase-like ring-hydroxylating dioxygenase large terminal subunit
MYVRNCWYVAAWASEIGRVPLTRTFLGEPVLLYRTEAGRAVALEDRCCHRNLPLSLGRIEGDAVRCGYHGLTFGPDGICIRVPGQDTIPAGARVKSYALIERWKLIWIWIGDPARADETILPDWAYLDDPKLSATIGNGGRPLHMKCNWELNNDNLLDLSHTVFVHGDTLGGDGPDRFPIRTERLPRGVRMSRWMSNVPPIPLFARLMNYDGSVDRWQETYAHLPTHCTIDVGFVPAGKIGPDGDRDQGLRLRALLTATPETETTSFFFYVQCRNFAVGDEAISTQFGATFRKVMGEDIAVMEAQQRVNDAMPDAPTVAIRLDEPVIAMRRLLQSYATGAGA